MIITEVIVLVALFIGSITDFRKREVPDFLSYGTIFLGFLLNGIISHIQKDYRPILFSFYGALICLTFSALMFLTGQWGGGDAKILVGIGALLGFTGVKGLLVLFIVNAMIVGAFYGLIYSYVLAIINWRSFLEGLKRKIKRGLLKIILSAVFYFALVLLAILLLPEIRLAILIVALFILFMAFSFMVATTVQESCMIKKYPVSKLTEGDWVMKDVIVNGKKIYKVRKIGILAKDIERLKKHKVKSVIVKEGIPFVPSFFIAFVLSLFYNWFTVFF